MKIVVVMPTYNEEDNIGKMIDVLHEEIFPQLKKHDLELLVVDDNSPDKTQEIVKKKTNKYENIHLFTGEKKGLGVAYVRGIKYAMENLDAEWVVEMDADFQHNPNDLVPMILAAEEGYDYIIGSRYIEGGSIPKEWALIRKLQSVLGNLLARIVLWLPQIHDVTSGFKMSKVKEYLDKIDIDEIVKEEYSRNYAYKIFLLFKMIKQGAKVKEVPINFQSREEGDSKMPKNNIKDSLRMVLTLRWLESQRFIKVCAVGTIGAAIQFTIFNILRRTLNPEIANVIAVEFAIIGNFIINNSWTFKDKKLKIEKGLQKIILKFAQFNLFSLGSLLIQYIVMKIGTNILGRGFIIENGLVVVGILLGLIYNFTIYTKLIWKTTNKKEK